MKVFGLTGGVGMGKSTAADVLRAQGVPVVDTDVLAREIVKPGQPALQEIRSVFGSEIVSADGTLQRDKLATVVFCNSEKRRELEAITHPRIRNLWRSQIETWRRGSQTHAVVVIPLLFETLVEKELDATICVACSMETQMSRLRQRGWDEDQSRQRIAAQWPTEKKLMAADFVVWSEGSLEALTAQLSRIIR